MQQDLPNWFNEKEFDTFITEGPLAQQAWVKGLKRWARTRYAIRKTLGSMPAKYTTKGQLIKHAMLANTAIQNARDIQSAKNREEMIQAKRNYIQQEQFEVNFDNYLEEMFTRGSQRAFNLGIRPSAGERADMKSPRTEKQKAKLKKREQRKDMKRRGEVIESIISSLFEADKKDPKSSPKNGKDAPKPEAKEKEDEKDNKVSARSTPKRGSDVKKQVSLEQIKRGDLSHVMVVETPGGDVEIITRESNRKDNKILAGKEENSISQEEQLVQYVMKDNFRVTPTARAIFKDRLDELLDKRKMKKKEEKDRESAQRTANKLKTGVEDAVQDPFSIVPPSPEEKGRPHGKINKVDAELLFWLSDIVDGRPVAVEMKKWLGKSRIELIRQNITQNPGYFATAEKLKAAIVEQAIQQNPSLQDKDLVVVPFGTVKTCAELSKNYKSLGSIDNTPKSDVIVLPAEDAKKLIEGMSTKNCSEELKKHTKVAYRASIKKGRAPAFSSQATETLAMLENVYQSLKQFFGGEIPSEISAELNMLIAEVRRLAQLANRGVLRTGEGINWTFLRKAQSKPPMGQTVDPREQEFYTSSAQILQKMNDILVSLLSRREVKAAIILEQMRGENKFGKDSLGVADSILTLDDSGNFTGRIPLASNLNDALKNEAFMKFVDEVKINAGRKSREWVSGQQSGEELSPAFRGEMVPGKKFNVQSKPLTSSFDPFDDSTLDILFEYTFNPPDVTISSLAPDPVSQNTPIPTDPMGYSPYQNQNNDNLNADTILALLVQNGFIETIYAEPIDFAELGMKISSMESPVKNKIVVNGRFFEIPVLNPNISETFLDGYERLNDELINFINEGMTTEEAQFIFYEQLGQILEGKKRNYKREYRLFHGKPSERKKRSKRVLARRKMKRKLGKKAIDGKDIDHKNGNAMDNSDGNLRVRSINKNRADNKHSKKEVKETWGAGLEGSWEATKKWLRQTPGQLGLIDPRLIKLLMRNKGKAR